MKNARGGTICINASAVVTTTVLFPLAMLYSARARMPEFSRAPEMSNTLFLGNNSSADG